MGEVPQILSTKPYLDELNKITFRKVWSLLMCNNFWVKIQSSSKSVYESNAINCDGFSKRNRRSS